MSAIHILQKIHIVFNLFSRGLRRPVKFFQLLFGERRRHTKIGLFADGLNIEDRARPVRVGLFQSFFNRIVLRAGAGVV